MMAPARIPSLMAIVGFSHFIASCVRLFSNFVHIVLRPGGIPSETLAERIIEQSEYCFKGFN
jgi:hypothetical protein